MVRGHRALGEHQDMPRGQSLADHLRELRQIPLAGPLDLLPAGGVEQAGERGPQLLDLLLPPFRLARLPPFEHPGRQLLERALGLAGVGVDVEEVERLEQARGRLPLAGRERVPVGGDRDHVRRVVDQLAGGVAVREDRRVGRQQHLAGGEQGERAEILQEGESDAGRRCTSTAAAPSPAAPARASATRRAAGSAITRSPWTRQT